MDRGLLLRLLLPVLGWLVLAAVVVPACEPAPPGVSADTVARANFAREPAHTVVTVVRSYNALVVRKGRI